MSDATDDLDDAPYRMGRPGPIVGPHIPPDPMEAELDKQLQRVAAYVAVAFGGSFSDLEEEDLEVIVEAKRALTRLLLEARKDALQGVQVYTDPSHQKVSPFTRLKTADQYINERIAQIDAETEALK